MQIGTISRNRIAKTPRRFDDLTQCHKRGALVVNRWSKGWIKRARCSITCKRFGYVALRAVGLTEIVVEMCICFIDIDRLADQNDRPAGIAGLKCNNTEQVKRIGIRRFGFKNRFVDTLSFSYCALAM